MAQSFQSVTVRVDREIHVNEIEIRSGDDVLTHLQGEVQGLIELIGLREDLDLWVNEDGRMTQDRNILLETMATLLGWQPPLYGHGVFTGGSDEDGNTIPLSNEQVQAIIDLAERADLLMVIPQ